MTYQFPDDFSEDVLLLISLGEKDAYSKKWMDYTDFLTDEHIPELIRVVEKFELFMPDDEEVYLDKRPEVYAPIHAWRALGQLKAEEAIPALIRLIIKNEDWNTDWVMEEIPTVMALIGPAAISPLREYLRKPNKLEWAAVTVSSALADIGTAHPEYRLECINALTEALEKYAKNSGSLNALIISFLLDLKAVEAVPVVKKAFDAKAVELDVLGDYEEFLLELGLIERRTTPAPRFLSEHFDIFQEQEVDPAEVKKLYSLIDPDLKKDLLS